MSKAKKTIDAKMDSVLVPFTQLEKQFELPLNQLRALIRSESVPTDQTIIYAVGVARMYGVPLQGINIIPSRQGAQVYINADGILWKLHTDPRKIRSITSQVTHRPVKDEMWAEVEARVEFQDGSFFTAIGSTAIDKQWTSDKAILKAETKATRRAGKKAVGTTLPTYEDYIEYRDEQMKDITPLTQFANDTAVNTPAVNEPISNPRTLSEFLIALGGLGLSLAEAAAKCGLPSADAVYELSEPQIAAAWEKIKS